jgi:hypothetical protein
MSYKPEVKVDGKWYPNGLAFATHDEARRWAGGLFARWTLTTDWRAVASKEPVTHKLTKQGLLQRLQGHPTHETSIRPDSDDQWPEAYDVEGDR